MRREGFALLTFFLIRKMSEQGGFRALATSWTCDAKACFSRMPKETTRAVSGILA